MAVLGAVLAAVGAMLLLTAVPGAAAPAAATCSAWVSVPYIDANKGYVNDRHARAGTQLRTCTSDSGAKTEQARATYKKISADTWGRPQKGITLRIYEQIGDCPSCTPLWKAGPIAEPGVGKTYYGPAVTVRSDLIALHTTDVSIDYVNPPNPFWYQTGSLDWFTYQL